LIDFILLLTCHHGLALKLALDDEVCGRGTGSRGGCHKDHCFRVDASGHCYQLVNNGVCMVYDIFVCLYANLSIYLRYCVSYVHIVHSTYRSVKEKGNTAT
jgi:hypothetical protein